MGIRASEFYTEEIQMAEKLLKKCSTFLGKCTSNQPWYSTSHQSEWLRSKTQLTADAGEDVEKDVGLQSGTTTLEISFVVPQKIGDSTT